MKVMVKEKYNPGWYFSGEGCKNKIVIFTRLVCIIRILYGGTALWGGWERKNEEDEGITLAWILRREQEKDIGALVVVLLKMA